MNRRRLKGETGITDCKQALTTLFGVLFTMTRVMAPFIPFLTEHMYQNMRNLIDPQSTNDQDTQSIHYLMLPEVRYAVRYLNVYDRMCARCFVSSIVINIINDNVIKTTTIINIHRLASSRFKCCLKIAFVY